MKSDIEIAQEAVLWPIQKVAEHLDIPEDDLELYGKYKAKLSDEYLKSIEDRKDGKLILVTAINPTLQERARQRPASDWARHLQNGQKSGDCAA